jgi:hypothetical protein
MKRRVPDPYTACSRTVGNCASYRLVAQLLTVFHPTVQGSGRITGRLELNLKSKRRYRKLA